jgi:hypothetical protein
VNAALNSIALATAIFVGNDTVTAQLVATTVVLDGLSKTYVGWGSSITAASLTLGDLATLAGTGFNSLSCDHPPPFAQRTRDD